MVRMFIRTTCPSLSIRNQTGEDLALQAVQAGRMHFKGVPAWRLP